MSRWDSIDISFAKEIAHDMNDLNISTEQARKALDITDGDYEDLKEYFLN
tara:strand:- start:11062 stop:11211 length:150 start_codon:yes stop_codon:yes gene_type:complete